jgi:tRNA (mo5U34)-methyltransferase
MPAGFASHSDIDDTIARMGPWFHNLHLPGGLQTCPDHTYGDFPNVMWRAFRDELPSRLDDWTVLDVGCNAGFYSFELARRGALVTAVDIDPHYLRQAEWAARRLKLEDRVDFRLAHVYDLARVERTWDLVLFLGVFYRLRYPALGLDILSKKTERLLVFQSLRMEDDAGAEVPADLPLTDRSRLRDEGWPRMAFIEKRVAGDPTNWWAPNPACLEALFRSSGMRVVKRPAREIYFCEPDEAAGSSVWDQGNVDYYALFGPPGGGAPEPTHPHSISSSTAATARQP